jgi:molecular chaperone GrpE
LSEDNKDTNNNNEEDIDNSEDNTPGSQDETDQADIEVIENETISFEDQVKELEDQLLRAKAEVQNVRRIAAQEVTKARLFGIESLAKEFLSVADNLERSIDICSEEENLVIKEGLELTLKNLESALKSSSIEPIDLTTKDFDPEKHEAISLLEDDTLEPNTIIDVVQKGYTILERTLRPAKVVVSRKSQEKK